MMGRHRGVVFKGLTLTGLDLSGLVLEYHGPPSLPDVEGRKGADTALDLKNLNGLEPCRPWPWHGQ